MASAKGQFRVIGNDDQAVTDELVGQLYKAGEEGALALIANYAPHQRAELAAFCYRRAHLHQIGLAIAATCGKVVLVQALGTAFGSVLYSQSQERAAPAVRAAGTLRTPVTLPRLGGGTPLVVPDIDDDDEVDLEIEEMDSVDAAPSLAPSLEPVVEHALEEAMA